MAREIKFRSWDIPTKEMSPVAWELNELIQATLRTQCFLPPENTIWMQYTGLKDRNGKEIYEGDVIKTSWQHDGVTNYDYDLTGEVKWCEDLLSWVIERDMKDQVVIHPLHSFEREELDNESIEVIGNVHENPGII